MQLWQALTLCRAHWNGLFQVSVLSRGGIEAELWALSKLTGRADGAPSVSNWWWISETVSWSLEWKSVCQYKYCPETQREARKAGSSWRNFQGNFGLQTVISEACYHRLEYWGRSAMHTGAHSPEAMAAKSPGSSSSTLSYLDMESSISGNVTEHCCSCSGINCPKYKRNLALAVRRFQ